MDVLQADTLNPIEKFSWLTDQRNSDAQLAEFILLGLYTIDAVVNEISPAPYNYYIHSDASVMFLLARSLKRIIPQENYLSTTILLDDAKLIYRFTTARKFKITESKLKQLRINSWGREYIAQNELKERYSTEFGLMQSFLRNYVHEHRKTYARLTDILLQPITPAVAEEVINCNSKIEIRLLS
ncbi:hypothetical protein ACFVVQ_04705 [Paenibacillus chitinolyticus]|uniref:hypothetical protein n=1 Tax=Paenibacillus chitinolyticus TaxID=79263 RepID=UPI0036DD55A2